MAKNYYAILGVLPTATLEEIRSAYRNRVKQYHPDHFGKDSAPFLNIQEAYEVLGNPASRTMYDSSLRESAARAERARPRPRTFRSREAPVESLRESRRPTDLGTIYPLTFFESYHPSYDEIFDSLWTDFYSPPKAERLRTMTMEVRLTRDQARRGGRVQIVVPLRLSCPSCKGLGEQGPFQCGHCAGTGTLPENFHLQVEYPPGIQDRHQVAVPLDRYGIPDVCPVLLFRVSRIGDFEDY